MAGGATPATRVLAAERVEHVVLRYHHDPASHAFGEEAVDALRAENGAEAAQVFKTLVVELGDGRLAVAIVPVPQRMSLKAVAAAFGSSKATMADPAKAERSSGYVTGGISPLGQRKALPTVIDSSVTNWDRVYCSAGRRGLEIGLAPADLIRLTGGVTAPIVAG